MLGLLGLIAILSGICASCSEEPSRRGSAPTTSQAAPTGSHAAATRGADAQQDTDVSAGAANAAAGRSVVVYCAVDTAVAKPLLREFEQRTKITVHPVFDTEAGKTTGLVNRLLAEQAAARADVWWSGEMFGTMQLAARGVLAPYKPASAADIPPAFRHPDGLWTAFGLRGRVLAYDPKRTAAEDVPRRWCDLTNPKYKGRVCLADPRFGTTRGHMAAILSLWGAEAVTDFYQALRADECQIVDSNSQCVLLLTRGRADIVATDTDDVILAQLRGESVAMAYPDLDAPDGRRLVAGTLWIPNSVALVNGAPHADAARDLIEFIASADVERRLYDSSSRNVPVRAALCNDLGVPVPRTAAVDYAAAAAALEQSDKLVRDVLLR